MLDVCVSLARGEAGRTEVLRLRCGDDVGAVNQTVHILAKRRDGGEDELEVLLELRLVVDERLPLASSARVTCDEVVGLETELAGERRLNLALVAAGAGATY